MTKWIPWGVGIATFLVATWAFGSEPTAPISSEGRRELLGYLDAAGMPTDWRTFLDATAHGESRWNSDVGLGAPPLAPPGVRMNTSAGEAKASCRAYDRQRESGRLGGSPYARDRYCFGSGGYFAMLPANAIVGAFKGTSLENIDPYEVFNAPAAVTMAIDYARRLRGWSSFQNNPTWLTLRVGWSNPSKMGDPAFRATVRERFAKSLREAGYPESFMNKRVSGMSWYPGARQTFQRLGAGNA